MRAPEQLAAIGRLARKDMVLSLGLIDGHNVWCADLPAILDRIKPIMAGWPLGHIEVAPSCSLLHVPIDLELQIALDADFKCWLVFSVQKMDELTVLARALSSGKSAALSELKAASQNWPGVTSSAMALLLRCCRGLIRPQFPSS